MRTREFDEKKVVSAALLAFWKNGFADTSLADLQQATGLGKASLYNAFESKEGLFQVALVAYLKEVGAQYDRLLSSDSNPKKTISNLMHGLIDRASQPPRGCLLVLSVQNSAHHTLATKKIFDAAFQTRENRLRKIVFGLSGKKEHLEALTQSLCVLIDGLLTSTRAGASAQSLHKSVDFTLKALMDSL